MSELKNICQAIERAPDRVNLPFRWILQDARIMRDSCCVCMVCFFLCCSQKKKGKKRKQGHCADGLALSRQKKLE